MRDSYKNIHVSCYLAKCQWNPRFWIHLCYHDILPLTVKHDICIFSNIFFTCKVLDMRCNDHVHARGRESSWCWLCLRWLHGRLLWWTPVQPVAAGLALWRFLVLGVIRCAHFTIWLTLWFLYLCYLDPVSINLLLLYVLQLIGGLIWFYTTISWMMKYQEVSRTEITISFVVFCCHSIHFDFTHTLHRAASFCHRNNPDAYGYRNNLNSPNHLM